MQANFISFGNRFRPSNASVGFPILNAAFRKLVAPRAGRSLTEIDYHAEVQRHLVDSFQAQGHKVVENIRLTTGVPDPVWTYDADFIMKPVDGSVPVIVELKTSLTKKDYEDFSGQEFRRKQFQVLILANLGSHVMTSNPRIVRVGLPFGAVLPPLAIMVIYGLPGQLYQPVYVPPGDLTELMGLIQ